jgi:hypothetical protein
MSVSDCGGDARTGSTRHTSTLDLLRRDMYELLDLVGGNIFAGPGILPARLHLCDGCGGIVGVLASLGRGSRALLGAEDIPEERHGRRGSLDVWGRRPQAGSGVDGERHRRSVAGRWCGVVK